MLADCDGLLLYYEKIAKTTGKAIVIAVWAMNDGCRVSLNSSPLRKDCENDKIGNCYCGMGDEWRLLRFAEYFSLTNIIL